MTQIALRTCYVQLFIQHVTHIRGILLWRYQHITFRVPSFFRTISPVHMHQLYGKCQFCSEGLSHGLKEKIRIKGCMLNVWLLEAPGFKVGLLKVCTYQISPPCVKHFLRKATNCQMASFSPGLRTPTLRNDAVFQFGPSFFISILKRHSPSDIRGYACWIRMLCSGQKCIFQIFNEQIYRLCSSHYKTKWWF